MTETPVMVDLSDLPNHDQQTPTNAGGKTAKIPSCVICSRRKVKCDRKNPCSSCSKHGVECVYRNPLPPRRGKRRASNVASSPEIRVVSRRRAGSPRDGMLNYMDDKEPPRLHHTSHQRTSKPEQGMLLTSGSNAVYVDDNVWTSVRDELPDAEAALCDMSDNDSDHSSKDIDEELSLLLRSSVRKSLLGLHPTTVHIFRLWQTFLENVNPLVKVLHAPTVQQRILEAMGDLASVPKETEALMFSIYCIALVSMSAEDVEKAFGKPKAPLLSNYRQGARLALSNADLLRTSNLIVLQAFFIFLLSMRAMSDPHSVWSLCGVAMRIAQRIGLHRDGSQMGLSVFETEMRRRLWLQLVILDATVARHSGINMQIPFAATDVQTPLNVNDSDLDPRMKEAPREHSGPTEMIFCLTRNEYGEWLRRWSRTNNNQTEFPSPKFLTSSSLSLKDKDTAIQELETAMKTKYLQHCDKSIPLHSMTTVMGHSIVSLMKFIAHHPRQYSERSLSIPQNERDRLFVICLQVAENGEAVQAEELTRRYSWHAENHIPWDAVIYMLYELQHRISGDQIQRAWCVIDKLFSRQYQRQRKSARSPLHLAMQSLLIKTWDTHSQQRAHRGLPTLPCPLTVSTIKGRRITSESHCSNTESSSQPDMMAEDTQRDLQETVNTSVASFGNSEIDFGTFDFNAMPWGTWDDLLAKFDQGMTDDEVFW
ncbi:Zn(II)2Cys6 transcription factor [Aspergillus clavatus NRRL 1]|uniref:Fungal specific transcription factor domain protein n=1 Tax=Aspergillus clavatus (strain ATCC 1007 / CBS 513.65 / DSM 816 / NCTC 3887 / NRRL 1 / QM 1276 / 107) TaxID=344612 RepID=A1CJK9_ASPCL|nr:fungal specific transcription factor domain protein [Aspergillus clavatus NRRL 1]EAW09333.1 fungal specific transcription factor domain protein [Aspergillus clavatus NRRL 1]